MLKKDNKRKTEKEDELKKKEKHKMLTTPEKAERKDH